jgi:hypothetical protein
MVQNKMMLLLAHKPNTDACMLFKSYKPMGAHVHVVCVQAQTTHKPPCTVAQSCTTHSHTASWLACIAGRQRSAIASHNAIVAAHRKHSLDLRCSGCVKKRNKSNNKQTTLRLFSKQASLLIGIASATLWLVDCLLDLLIQSANQLGALLLGKMSTSMLGKRPSPEGDLREEQGGLGVLVRV